MMRRTMMMGTLAAIPLFGSTTMSQAQANVDGELSAIWDKWIAMWNGNLVMADLIIAADYKLHMSPIGGEDVSVYVGPKGMAGWIGQLQTAINPLVFEVQVEPLFGDGMIAGRWLASGSYRGGFPGAQDGRGTEIKFAGADFLRIEDGKIVEYWLSSDQQDLLKQLKMFR